MTTFELFCSMMARIRNFSSNPFLKAYLNNNNNKFSIYFNLPR